MSLLRAWVFAFIMCSLHVAVMEVYMPFMVAVFDAKLNEFASPVCVPAVGMALRSFTDEANRKDAGNVIAAHPEDFSLHLLAVYDPEKGVFSTDGIQPRKLVDAVDVLRKE